MLRQKKLLRTVAMSIEREIAKAAELLRAGGLVAFPTETVYGLGADAENDHAVARVYAAKGRPTGHPLIVHVGPNEDLARWADEVPDAAHRLARAFWPGPLTLILSRRALLPLAATGGQASIGLRVPNHPVALALLAAFQGGVAAPSANRFGAVSPTRPEHVRRDLGKLVDMVLEGGPCAVGVESTIVDLTQGEPQILRPGGISREAIEHALNLRVPVRQHSSTRAPGLLASHYAPRAQVLLATDLETLRVTFDQERRRGRAVFALLREHEGLDFDPAFTARVPENDEDFARVLYDTLHQLDARGAEVIVTTLPEESGLGLAIADRLRRAAGPK